MDNYNAHKEWQLRTYKCAEKASDANRRFDDIISKYDILNTLIRFSFKCVYCSKTLSAKKWEIDHFYSRAMGGKNSVENLAPSCNWCNRMKGALDGFAFIHRCQQIAENNILISSFGDLYPNTPK